MTMAPLRRPERIVPGRWRVPSESDPGRTYDVQVHGDRADCNCLGSAAAHRNNNSCKHERQALAEERKMDENSTAVAVCDPNVDVVPVQYNPTFPTKQEIQSIIYMANNFYQLAGKMIPSSIKSAQEAFAVMIAGREWGLGPMESLREMYVVNGTTMPSYRVLAGAVLRGDPTASFKWIERGPTKATAQLIREGRETIEITYTIDDAKRAGLAEKDNWKKYPTDMLCAKVVTRLCRLGGPDLITRISATVRGAPSVMRAVEEDPDGESLAALDAAPGEQTALAPPLPAMPARGEIEKLLDTLDLEARERVIAGINQHVGRKAINKNGDVMLGRAGLTADEAERVLAGLREQFDEIAREGTLDPQQTAFT